MTDKKHQNSSKKQKRIIRIQAALEKSKTTFTWNCIRSDNIVLYL